MVRRILKLPVKILRGMARAVRDGGRDQPFPEAGLQAMRAPAPAAPAPAAPAPAAPAISGGHDHDHGHDHGHRDEPSASPVSVSFEGTPNPNAMKFVLDRPAVPAGSLSFTSPEEAAGDPLGERLFQIPGVVGIFAVKDFVTVTKEASVSWGGLTHPIVEALEALYR